MNIIHLLSQNHLTGAEVYAATLVQSQITQGHHVFQISNGFFYPTEAVKFEVEVETKSKFTFIKNVLWLRNLIKKQNIHVIHSHSRSSAKLAYWATLFTNTAQVSTVHGVQHPSFSKKLHNQYGQLILTVCENLKTHLIQDFSYNEERIKVLRNPVSSEKYYFINKIKSQKTKIAIIGRTTGPKKERTEQVLNALIDFDAEITVIGGSLEQLNLNSTIKRRVNELKVTELNSEIYSQFDIVIGSGRVCMESIITGIKTIAFGEACYIGPITAENFKQALHSNFGDIYQGKLTPDLNLEQFLNDITQEMSDQKILSEMALKEFSLTYISKKITRYYESAFFLKNYSKWIPILMYHKIPDQKIESSHKIFVTKNNFEKHLIFLKKRGFTTLTFSDLKKFRSGLISFSEFPKKPLILTFDDGYRDNFENASPLLNKYGFKAQLFLLADASVDHNYWDTNKTEPAHSIISGQERKVWKNSAFEIGSHGFRHKKITEFSSDEALQELKNSKIELEKEFNEKVNVFAYTYGITNENSAQSAEDAGYDYAVNTDTGGLLLEADPYRIFRVNMFPDENSVSLFKKTSTWYRQYYRYKRRK